MGGTKTGGVPNLAHRLQLADLSYSGFRERLDHVDRVFTSQFPINCAPPIKGLLPYLRCLPKFRKLSFATFGLQE